MPPPGKTISRRFGCVWPSRLQFTVLVVSMLMTTRLPDLRNSWSSNVSALVAVFRKTTLSRTAFIALARSRAINEKARPEVFVEEVRVRMLSALARMSARMSASPLFLALPLTHKPSTPSSDPQNSYFVSRGRIANSCVCEFYNLIAVHSSAGTTREQLLA
jgi:hypothetical protein